MSKQNSNKSFFHRSGRDCQEVYDDEYEDLTGEELLDPETTPDAGEVVEELTPETVSEALDHAHDVGSADSVNSAADGEDMLGDSAEVSGAAPQEPVAVIGDPYDEDEEAVYNGAHAAASEVYLEEPDADLAEADAAAEEEKKRQKSKKHWKVGNIVLQVVAVVAAIVLMVTMILNVPIIEYETTSGSTTTIQQVSILKYIKLWQPLVEQEGTIEKVDSTDSEALDLRSDLDSSYNDGLDLDQTIEGQYTILFLGMDESGELSDVNWIFQFDIIEGTLNILQIPRDSYMPGYASASTMKFNSIYASGQETGVTPIQRVINAIEDNFCMYIDCYVKLDCDNIADIVDSIGGIPITLPEEIVYEADKVLEAGEQVLSGEEAEWFIRYRHGYDEGDIGRVKAQRIFLAAAFDKMMDMTQTEILAVLNDIYDNEWVATDLSLEQMSMIADFAQNQLTLDEVNIFMVPGEGATYYAYDGTEQSVYSIHKSSTIDLLNTYFRPYQNEIYADESAIVELVPEGEYQSTTYDDTQENLEDINEGDTDDGEQ